MTAKINKKALKKTETEAIIWATRDLSGLPANFARNFTRKIIETYLESCEKIEAEEAEKESRERAERADEKDVGWFPGDCCD